MRQNLIYNTFAFLFSPILSLLLACRNILYDNRNIYFIGAFFSVFGAFLPPTSDAYRYRELYYKTTTFNFDWSNYLMSGKDKDFLFVLLSSIFNGIGLPFELFKFILLLFCYYLYCWMFLDITKSKEIIKDDNTLMALAIASLFLCIRLFTLTAGIRFGVASTIVIVAIYLCYKQKFIHAIVIYAISMTMHYSMIAFLPIVIGAFLLRLVRAIPVYAKVGIVLLLLILANSAIGDLLIYFFPENNLVVGGVSGYIEGHWGTQEIMKTASFGGLMFTLVRILPIFPLGYFVIRREENDFMSNVCFLLIVLLCISISSITLLLRYSNVAIAIVFVSMLVNFEDIQSAYKEIKIALVAFVIMFGCYAYTQRASLSLFGLHYKVCISPLTIIYNYEYTDQWVRENLDFRGEYTE